MRGEMVKASMGDGHWGCLEGVPRAFYLPAVPCVPPVDGDSTPDCRGGDILAEGDDEQLDELGKLLKHRFEVTASPRLGLANLVRRGI